MSTLRRNYDPAIASVCVLLLICTTARGFNLCKRLFNLCTTFASEHFEVVIQCSEFLALPCNQLTELISMDEIRVSSEDQVYTAVLQWVYHDLEGRKEALPRIMSLVRLPFVSQEFIECEVEREQLMQEKELCQEFIREAHLYKAAPEKRPSLKHSPRTSPRKPPGLQDVIVAVPLCPPGVRWDWWPTDGACTLVGASVESSLALWRGSFPELVRGFLSLACRWRESTSGSHVFN